MNLLRRHGLTIIALILYWPGIFVLTHIPISAMPLPLGVNLSDKVLHYIAYLSLAFLLWFAIYPNTKVNWKKAPIWWMLFVVVWYGVFDEWLQGYVGRDPDVLDFLADLGGAITALIMLSIFSFWTAALIITGASIFIFTNFVRANPDGFLIAAIVVFHLLSYAFFAVLWMRWMYYFVPVRMPEPKWLAGALALPFGFLILNDLFSLMVIGNGEPLGIVCSAAGIILPVFSAFLFARCRAKQTS